MLKESSYGSFVRAYATSVEDARIPGGTTRRRFAMKKFALLSY
jgi:hypothetical protein